jgi:hypothetical protein
MEEVKVVIELDLYDSERLVVNMVFEETGEIRQKRFNAAQLFKALFLGQLRSWEKAEIFLINKQIGFHMCNEVDKEEESSYLKV